jgi:uncharacterized protein
MEQQRTIRHGATGERLVGLDAARGLAVLVMAVVNFDIVLTFGVDEPGWIRACFDVCTGRASACFVTLAGVGFVLLGDRAVLARRALFLAALGYGWYELWPGDILHHYAAYLLLAAATLGCSSGRLVALAAVAIGGFVAAFFALDYGSDWNWLKLEYKTFWTPAGQLRNAAFNGLHPVLPWMAFAWIGMAAGKLDLGAPAGRRRLMAIGAAMAAVAWALSVPLASQPDSRGFVEQFVRWYRAPSMFWGLSSIPPGPLYVLSGAGTALLTIGLCLEACAREAWRRRLSPLIACGQLALSLYVAHVLFLFFLVQPIRGAVEAEGPLSAAGKMWVTGGGVVAFWAAALLGSWAWRRCGRRGPLEALMRRLAG